MTAQTHNWRTLDEFPAILCNDHRNEDVTEIQAEDGELLCYANPDRALYIVHACNSQDKLVSALRMIGTQAQADGNRLIAEYARAALKAAEL